MIQVFRQYIEKTYSNKQIDHTWLNYIVYYLEADIGSSGSGELVLRDHEGTEVLVETFSPGTNQHIMGTVAGSSGNWTLEISLSGNADVRARIAGAIQYTYSV